MWVPDETGEVNIKCLTKLGRLSLGLLRPSCLYRDGRMKCTKYEYFKLNCGIHWEGTRMAGISKLREPVETIEKRRERRRKAEKGKR